MLHQHRCWQITDVDDADLLAEMLTERTWTMCTGFRYAGLLFLNDSFGPDGAQEYAIVREGDSVQVESWTCSWMTSDRCAAMIRSLVAAGGVTQFQSVVMVNPHPAGPCPHCA